MSAEWVNPTPIRSVSAPPSRSAISKNLFCGSFLHSMKMVQKPCRLNIWFYLISPFFFTFFRTFIFFISFGFTLFANTDSSMRFIFNHAERQIISCTSWDDKRDCLDFTIFFNIENKRTLKINARARLMT